MADVEKEEAKNLEKEKNQEKAKNRVKIKEQKDVNCGEIAKSILATSHAIIEKYYLV